MRYLILALLLPSLLMAGGFKVTKPEIPTGPPGWAEVGRGETWKQFQHPTNDSVFAAVVGLTPLHYDDPAAGWVEINYSEVDTAGLFDKIIRRGGKRADIYYSTTLPGAMKFARRNGWLQYIPAWDTTQVGVEFIISDNGLKENIYLDESSPNRLAWGFVYTRIHENEGKGKGRIKNILNQSIVELGALVAWDALKNNILVTVTYTADSLIVEVDTAGAVWPITVDPSVQDTILTTWAFIRPTAGAVYLPIRNATSGGVNKPASNISVRNFVAGGDFFVERAFTYFDFTGFPAIVGVDSARYFINLNTVPGSARVDTLRVVESTQVGDTTGGWFNDFRGWEATGAYDSIATDFLFCEFAANSSTSLGWYSQLFNANGIAKIFSVFGSDSLRLVHMTAGDIASREPADNDDNWSIDDTPAPYIIIYYDAGYQPGITPTIQDSVLYRRPLYVQVDSTGGTDITTFVFKYFPYGDNSDTTSITLTGTFGASGYGVITDSLVSWGATDSLVYWIDATNAVGTTTSISDTISVRAAASASSTPLNVMGVEGTSTVN